MSKICLNKDVWDRYYAGDSLNDAITDVFGDEIQERVNNNAKLEKLSPLSMVMMDAGIKRTDKMENLLADTVNNSAYTSGGIDTNQWLFPAFVETTLREAMYDTNYLPYVVSTRVGIDSNTVQSPMLNLLSDENKKGIKKARIAEGADIPTGKIVIGSKAITLWKHGRAIELTYEALRRMRIDLFTRQMRAIAADIAHQEIEAATDVLVNGDGNDGTAASKLITSSTANKITSADIIDALVEYSFKNHFNADTMIMPKSFLKDVAQLTYDTDLAPGASMRVKFNIPQIGDNNVTLIGVPELKIGGKDAIVLENRDLSLIRYEENGSNIQEMDRFIRNQTQLMTLTENSGYAINVAGSNQYIEVKNA